DPTLLKTDSYIDGVWVAQEGNEFTVTNPATLKTLVLELGGHAPFRGFDDADMERAVECALSAKFATLFVQLVEELSVGLGINDPNIGPLMNRAAIDKQQAHVDDALRQGAKLLTGGGTHPAGPLFFTPTILGDVSKSALVFHEETFGPVAALAPFDTEEEAVSLANASEYGLVAYLHTRDERRIERCVGALNYGMIAVNRTKITGAQIPFGGIKQSGLGREGSRFGIETFTHIKYVCKSI
ncbi:MAG: aldehyde dehydrogenase family protein, partial [Rhizobiaceae bacterium]|nr:aldehyde dehydrogenase family protein [Rhizobiaceae bacterium]